MCLGVEIDRNKERGSFLGRGVQFFGQGFILEVRGSTLIFFWLFRGLDAPTSKDELSEIAWSRELLSLEGRFFVLIESVSGSD